MRNEDGKNIVTSITYIMQSKKSVVYLLQNSAYKKTLINT